MVDNRARTAPGRAAGAAIENAKKRAEKQKMAVKPPAYNRPELLAWRLSEYLQRQAESGGSILVYGLYRSAGISAETWTDYEHGSRDANTIYSIGDGDKLLHSREDEDVQATYIATYRQRQELHPYMLYICTGTIAPTDSTISLDTLYTETNIRLELGHETFGKMLKADIYYSEICKNARMFLYENVENNLIGGKLGDVVRANNILGWSQTKEEKHTFEIATEDEAKQALSALGLLNGGEKTE